jgi:hypothetical protein
MKPLAGYPRWFFAALMAVMAGLLCSGIALLPSMLQMRLDMDTPWRIEGGSRMLAAVSHCATSFMLIGLIGALLAIHVRIGWRRQLNRISGTLLLALVVILLASSLGIYYLGDEFWSRVCSISHTGAGLLAVLLLVWHVLNGRRLRRETNVARLNVQAHSFSLEQRDSLAVPGVRKHIHYRGPGEVKAGAV